MNDQFMVPRYNDRHGAERNSSGSISIDTCCPPPSQITPCADSGRQSGRCRSQQSVTMAQKQAPRHTAHTRHKYEYLPRITGTHRRAVVYRFLTKSLCGRVVGRAMYQPSESVREVHCYHYIFTPGSWPMYGRLVLLFFFLNKKTLRIVSSFFLSTR